MIRLPKYNLHRILLFLIVALITLVIGLLAISGIEKDEDLILTGDEDIEVSGDTILIGNEEYQYETDNTVTAKAVKLKANDTRYYYLYIQVTDVVFDDLVKIDTKSGKVLWVQKIDIEHQYYDELVLKGEELVLFGKYGVTTFVEEQENIILRLSTIDGQEIK